MQSFKAEPDYGRAADMMAGYLPLSLEEKETLLETVEVKARLRSLYELLTREREIAGIAKDISQEVHKQVEKNQKNIICVNRLRLSARN